MTISKVKHRFADIDLLMCEKGTIISHYKNERIYHGHKIFYDGKEFVLEVDIYGFV